MIAAGTIGMRNCRTAKPRPASSQCTLRPVRRGKAERGAAGKDDGVDAGVEVAGREEIGLARSRRAAPHRDGGDGGRAEHQRRGARAARPVRSRCRR